MITALQARESSNRRNEEKILVEVERIDRCIQIACSCGDYSCEILTKMPKAITDLYSKEGYSVIKGQWKGVDETSLTLSWHQTL